MDKQIIYLDNNATTSLDPEVLLEMDNIHQLGPLNPSSSHFLGRKAKGYLEKARQQVADFFQVNTREIIFTSSGTEALNFLIKGIAKDPNSTHIITSCMEHSSIINTMKYLETKGSTINYLPSENFQAITPLQIEKAITKQTNIVVLSWVNGETGLKTDIEKIAKICTEKNILFIVDAVALMGKELFSIPEGVSALAISGHKFHGPKGSGIAFIREDIPIQPLFQGGHQEYQLRAGTENLPNIVGLAKAITLLPKYLPKKTVYMANLRDFFEEELQKIFPIQVNGQGNRICNVSNLCFTGIEAETLLFYLDQNKILVSHGSACGSLALAPSFVLTQMGYSKERVLSSLRFSLCRNTTQKEIEKTLEALAIFFKKDIGTAPIFYA